MFKPLPDKPDHPALELEILELWEREGTFERLREQNRGGPKFSFVDGPVTANRGARRPHRLGPHAEGRLPALQGAAGLRASATRTGSTARGSGSRSASSASSGSTRRRRSRSSASPSSPAAAARSSSSPRGADRGLDPARPVDGLGQRLLHLQRHEHRVHLALPASSCTSAAGSTSATARPSGARAAAPRSPRTSSSAATSTAPTRRSSCASRCSTGRGEALVIWTTTPWTLPANVAAAVKPDAEYGRRENGEWVAVARYPDETFDERRSGAELVGWRYEGPFDDARARRGRRAPRDPVGRRHARRGHRHRPHRAGLRLGGLRALARPRPARADAGRRGGPLLRRLRLAARALHGRGGGADRRLPRRARAASSRRACTSTATRTAGAATRR